MAQDVVQLAQNSPVAEESAHWFNEKVVSKMPKSQKRGMGYWPPLLFIYNM